MEILFLGTSGAGITQSRNLPSILINRSLLFDCGEGCLAALYRHNISLESIKAIFLSHVHADHVLGLLSILYKVAFYTPFSTDPPNERKSFPIYVPMGAKDDITQIIKATYSTFGNVKYTLQIIELPDSGGDPIVLGTNGSETLIEWFPSIHIPKCFAYRINKQVVITGDTAYNPELIKFVQNIRLLIHEAALCDGMEELGKRVRHSTPNQAAMIAKQCNVSRLILYHIPDIEKESEHIFLENAKNTFNSTTVAHDDEIIQI